MHARLAGDPRDDQARGTAEVIWRKAICDGGTEDAPAFSRWKVDRSGRYRACLGGTAAWAQPARIRERPFAF